MRKRKVVEFSGLDACVALHPAFGGAKYWFLWWGSMNYMGVRAGDPRGHWHGLVPSHGREGYQPLKYAKKKTA
jgi:hypothetical protein